MKNIRFVTLLVGLLLLGVGSTLAQTQPTQARTDEYRRKGPCRDPWISWAYIDASSGIDAAAGFGDYGQCNSKWYNNGSWSNYNELYYAVREYRNSLSRAGISYSTKAQSNGTTAYFTTIDGVMYGTLNKGGNLVGNDGASLRTQSNGLISESADGYGGIVAAGGGNYTVLSGAKKRIKVGRNTYLVIKK